MKIKIEKVKGLKSQLLRGDYDRIDNKLGGGYYNIIRKIFSYESNVSLTATEKRLEVLAAAEEVISERSKRLKKTQEKYGHAS